MTPHFILLFGASTLVLLTSIARLRKNGRLLSLLLVLALLVSFGGLRADHVGVDTLGYLLRFYRMSAFDQIWDTTSSMEIGTKTIYAIALIISDNGQVFLMTSSLITVTLYFAVLARDSRDLAASLFVFIAFGYYVFHFNGLRQGIALGFYLLAINQMVNGSFSRYLVWVMIGSAFHVSVILTLPLYFVFRLGISPWNFGIMLVSSLAFLFYMSFFGEVVGIVNARYTTYFSRTETGGELLALSYTLFSLFFLICRRLVRREMLISYDKYLMMLFFGTTIFVTVTIAEAYVEITRMALYFTVAMVFLWPILLKSIRGIALRLFFIVILVVSGSLFYGIFLNRVGGYIPYAIG